MQKIEIIKKDSVTTPKINPMAFTLKESRLDGESSSEV